MLCIDVEPDDFFVSRELPNPWEGFELTHAFLRTFRQELQQATGRAVKFCWFIRMDPQIALAHGTASWAVHRYEEFFREYMAAGDAIGCHVHTYRWCTRSGGWIDDHHNDEWVEECLGIAVDDYRKCFGKPCELLRFGNYWCSTQAINHAEALGFTFDLTIEPGLPPNTLDPRKPPHTGPLPDYFRVPRVPYSPSYRDFRRKARGGGRRMTLMPLTSAYLHYGWGPGSLRQRWRRIITNGCRHRLQDTPLSMWRDWQPPNAYHHMLDRAIAVQRTPYFAFALHSNFPVEPLTHPRVVQCLETLFSHPHRSQFVFCTPSEAMAMLRESASAV